MTDYLIFRLYGPMASWGDIAVGEYRPTHDHPSKSAIIGLIASALGIRRDEEKKHNELSDGYNFAVILNASGNLLRDYHTSQVPKSGSGKNKKQFATRKDELAVPKEELKTILSARDYYCDAFYTVCLWSKKGNNPFSIEIIKQKLTEPEFVLYLGRKSCPLSLPIAPKIVNGLNLKEVLNKLVFDDKQFLANLKKDDSVRVYWEGENVGFSAVHTITRRDNLLSRKRWQFADRTEHYAMIQTKQEV